MNTTRTADVVVIGGGVMGCSTAYNLVSQGARNVVLLEKGAICSGGTAKSCAIVRTHYSVRANMVHAVESLKIFRDFGETVGGESGFQRTGYLILGPEEHRKPMEAVFQDQKELGIDTATITREEAREIYPLFNYSDVEVIGYDSMTGFCDPDLTTNSYARRARELGATILTETPVTGILQTGGTKTVLTPSGTIESPVVVIAAGPWTNGIGKMIGVEFPYVVSKHKVITLKTGQPYRMGWPATKDLTAPDKIYTRPWSGGAMLVGTGDHGDPLDDPDTLTDHVDGEHLARIGELMAHRVPSFADAEYAAGWTGPYDITPDWNPIVGPVPGEDGVFVAVGFGGHGFKLSPTIGESLAQTVLGMEPRVPIDAYDVARFDKGLALHGAYGIGSIA